MASANSSEAALVAEERRGYWYENFARGPDTILYGSLWVPAVLMLAASDGICGSFDGRSSLWEGEACTQGASWNETLFALTNGTKACAIPIDPTGVLKGVKYVQDTNLDGCEAALRAYAAAVEGGFTCNCTGDFSFLPSGVRSSNVITIQNWVNSLLLVLILPFFGSAIDFFGQRPHKWKILTAIATASILGTAVLSSGHVWIVAMVFAAALHVATESIWLVKVSFIEDIAQDDPTRAHLGGMTQVASFGGQLAFVIIAGGLAFALGTVTGTIAACGVNALWFSGFQWNAVRKMRSRPPKRPAAVAGSGGGLCGFLRISLHDHWSALRELVAKYPQAAKYLVFHALCNNGPAQFLAFYGVYFSQQLKLTGLQILMISAAVLVVGTPAGYIFGKLGKRFSFKSLWAVILVVWTITLAITPLVVYKEGDFLGSILIGALVYAVALSWYFSIGWVAFAAMIPKGQDGHFGGIYTSSGIVGGLIEPPIWYALNQATNDARYGIWSLAVWCLLALLFLPLIDFEQGKRDAAAPDAVYEDGAAGPAPTSEKGSAGVFGANTSPDAEA